MFQEGLLHLSSGQVFVYGIMSQKTLAIILAALERDNPNRY
jgi:hypothetical protein